MNRDLLGSATCPWRRNSKRAVHSEAVPSQQRPLPSRLATWTPPLVTPEPHARSTPPHSGYYPLKQQLQHIPTRQPSPSFQNAQTATCTTPLLPMSTDSPLSHEHKLVYALYRKHSSRPHCPQAPALENGRTKTCTTHNNVNIYDAPPTHQRQLLATGTKQNARHDPTASFRAPPKPTTTGYLVQEQNQLHVTLQQHHAEHPRSPPAPGTWYRNSITCTTSLKKVCRAPPQPTSAGHWIQEQHKLHSTCQ